MCVTLNGEDVAQAGTADKLLPVAPLQQMPLAATILCTWQEEASCLSTQLHSSYQVFTFCLLHSSMTETVHLFNRKHYASDLHGTTPFEYHGIFRYILLRQFFILQIPFSFRHISSATENKRLLLSELIMLLIS